MGLLALSSLLVAGTGFYLLSRIWPNLSATQRRVQKDIKELRELLRERRAGLIPLSGSELEILSDEQVQHKRKRGFRKMALATFNTIYGEPILTYGYRKYLNGPDGLLMGYTSNHEYIFWIRAKGSRLVIDEGFVGELGTDGQLKERPKDREVLASITPQENGMDIIRVGDREVATLAKLANRESNIQNRVFELVANDLNPREREILWALTLFDLVYPLK